MMETIAPIRSSLRFTPSALVLLAFTVGSVGPTGPAAAQAELNAMSVLVDGLKQGGILVPTQQQCPAFWTAVVPDDVVTQNGLQFRICKLDPSFDLDSNKSDTTNSTSNSSNTSIPDGAQLQAQIMATWAGTFDTSFGIAHLTPNTSRGDYAYSNGRITVTFVDGATMRGTWEQDTSSKQCPDGRFYGQFTFQANAAGFTGNFGYCDDAPGAGVWNGTKK